MGADRDGNLPDHWDELASDLVDEVCTTDDVAHWEDVDGCLYHGWTTCVSVLRHLNEVECPDTVCRTVENWRDVSCCNATGDLI